MANKLPISEKSIILVGLMGAGKSTIGKRLARRLGLSFVDTDHEIEIAAAHSIIEIFARFGEESFRDGERRIIKRLIEGQPKVIATGGGAFMNEHTRSLLLERCIVLWLDASIETLAKRVSRRNTRPLLQDKDPFILLRDLAATRNHIYAEAHIHVKSQADSHERTVEHIIEALIDWEQRQ